VSFRYARGDTVLEHVSLTVAARSTVALVGPTGVGKTTLVSLIPRFYDVVSGSIAIDGRDVREVTLRSLRSQISIVSQDVFLFHGSVRENILFGREGATDDDVRSAAASPMPTSSSPASRRATTRSSASAASSSPAARSSGWPSRARCSRTRHPDPGRGDLLGGHAHGDPDPAGPGAPHEEPHGLRHRSQAVHGANRGPHRGPGRHRHRGDGTHAELMAREGLYRHLIEVQSRFDRG